MKKILVIMCTIVLLAGMFSLSTSAASDINETVISETVEYFEDGSSVVITVTESSQNAGISPRITQTKTGSKSYVYRDSSDTAVWKFTLNGTFQYESGESATCVASSYSKTIYDSDWSLKTASASRSGAKAIGSATFVKKVLGITTTTKSCSLELKCDTSGNLS